MFDDTDVFRIKSPHLRMMRRERVRVVRFLREWLPYADVREVGSTAVPGVIGKEDLDFAIKVSADKFDCARMLLDTSFIRNPHQLSDHCIQGYNVESGLEVSLQLIVRNSPYDIFDSFLCMLKQDAELRDAYNRLKMQWDGKSMQAYRHAKDAFIAQALSRA